MNIKKIMDPVNLNQLRWACRRGMLELDVLLGNFLEIHYKNLTFSEKKLFCELLTFSDPALFSYLLKGEKVKDQCLALLIAKIKHAQSPF